jgi:hypothetical protein
VAQSPPSDCGGHAGEDRDIVAARRRPPQWRRRGCGLGGVGCGVGAFPASCANASRAAPQNTMAMMGGVFMA